MRCRSLERIFAAMKRFASLITTAALTSSLVGMEQTARASSELYMVPISPLDATYAPGDIVRFAAVVDLNTSAFASLTIPFATAWTDNEFGGASGGHDSIYNGTAPYVDGQPTQIDPNGLHGATVFSKNLQYYTTTASNINGNTVYTVQNGVVQLPDIKNGRTVAFPAGTYTLGTFAFPIAANNDSGSATVYMPTPFGFSDSPTSTDGAFAMGTGPLNGISGRSARIGFDIIESITFPSTTETPTNGKYSLLTFKVSTVPEPGNLALLVGVATIGVSVLRKRRES